MILTGAPSSKKTVEKLVPGVVSPLRSTNGASLSPKNVTITSNNSLDEDPSLATNCTLLLPVKLAGKLSLMSMLMYSKLRRTSLNKLTGAGPIRESVPSTICADMFEESENTSCSIPARKSTTLILTNAIEVESTS